MYSFVIVAVGNGIIFLQALALEMFVEISLVTWHLGGFGIRTEWAEFHRISPISVRPETKINWPKKFGTI